MASSSSSARASPNMRKDDFAKLLDAGEYAIKGDVDEAIHDLRFELEILRELVADDMATISQELADAKLFAPYVQRVGRVRVHVVASRDPAAPVRWRTLCGWAFANSRFCFKPNPDGSVPCKRCFRAGRAHTTKEQDEEADTEGSLTTSASSG